MLLEDAFFFGYLVLTILNLFVSRRDVLYPPFLFSLVWLFTFGLYVLHPIELDQIGENTMFVVFAGAVFFSLGGNAAFLLFRRQLNSSTVKKLDLSPSRFPFKHFLLLICIAMLPYFFGEIQRLSASSGLDSFFVGARAAMTEAGEKGNTFSNPLLSNLPTMSIFLSFMYLIEKKSGWKETAWYAASVAVALAYSILTTGRTTLLALVLGSICIYLLKNRRVNMRIVLPVGILTFAAMNALVFVMKDLSLYEGKSIFQIIWFFITAYFVAPLAAFDHVLNDPTLTLSTINHTFSPIMKMISALTGMAYEAPPVVDENVFVPFNTNVYTIYKFYYVDFGLAGMLFAIWVIGYVQTYIYVKARGKSEFFMFVFAVTMFPLLTSFLDDQYFQWIFHMKTVATGFLYLHFFRRIRLMPPDPGKVESAPIHA